MSEMKWYENTASVPGSRCINVEREGRIPTLCYIQSHEAFGFSDDDAFALANKVSAVEELYEALSEWDEPGDCGCDTSSCKGTCVPAKTRAALAKARGES